MKRMLWLARLQILWLMLSVVEAMAAPIIAPDWQGREPNFEPGSLFWRTREFPNCPVVYRTVICLPDKPIEFAALQLRSRRYAYLFVTRFDRFSDLDPLGESIASAEAPKENPDGEVTLFADLTTHLRKVANILPTEERAVVLLVSAPADGFSLEGVIAFRDGSTQWFVSDPNRWRAQKLPPLTVLEFEPSFRPDFDDRTWFPVKVVAGAFETPPSQQLAELRAFAQQAQKERLQRRWEEARWRLTLLRDKGIVLVDDEAFGFGGAGRLREGNAGWVLTVADRLLREKAMSEVIVLATDALSLFVWARDEMTNLALHADLWQALRQSERSQRCAERFKALAPMLQKAEALLKPVVADVGSPQTLQRLSEALALLTSLRRELLTLRDGDVTKALVINDFNGGLENKFGWFDTTALLDNDITRWGLRVATPAWVFASPLSPAALVTVEGREFTLTGWDELKPCRVYQKPPNPTPVCLWAVIDGKVQNLRPSSDGVVYERERHGRLSENWLLLVSDLSRGGGLPIQIVCLQPPVRVTFRLSEKGTQAVTLSFDKPNAQLFVLKPLKEWRGLLRMAQVMTEMPLDEKAIAPYLAQCRLWSRAVLCYPIGFSETFVPDPNDANALIVANSYAYREFRDAWGTEPLKLASLPPLASYGLLKGYPKLQVLSDAKVLGSWGVWGDHIAVVGSNVIIYRVPLHPIKRFGGFTAFCFGPTDIGVSGNLTELALIQRTGANSFRPQHNRTDEAAMQLVRWCAERGLQHVFNVDEKWLSDVVEHYRTLAKLCKDFPPDAVAYDLLNEPETREPRAYNALLRRITQAIREVDKTHLIYAEVIAPWGSNAQPYPEAAFANLEPTDDPLTVYSFHDYEVRLMPRYPNGQVDIRTLLNRWLPAFRFSIDHRAPIHLGEFGAFEQTKEDIYANRCAITLLLDYFRIFDRFGWHFHYYSNRGIVRVRRDGSVQESLVQEAFRRYFGRQRLNAVKEQSSTH
jgi:hypothetical protein